MQRKPVASVSALRASVFAPSGATPRQVAETGRSMKHTGKPVMKSALWAYESAAVAAHEIPPDGGTKAALCAAYSAFTNVKTEFAKSRFVDDCRLAPTSMGQFKFFLHNQASRPVSAASED